MMWTGSGALRPRRVHGPTSRHEATAPSLSASARISTALGTWSSASSTSSTATGLRRAMTSSPPTTLPSFNSHRSGYGCALISPRPSQESAIQCWRATIRTFFRLSNIRNNSSNLGIIMNSSNVRQNFHSNL